MGLSSCFGTNRRIVGPPSLAVHSGHPRKETACLLPVGFSHNCMTDFHAGIPLDLIWQHCRLLSILTQSVMRLPFA